MNFLSGRVLAEDERLWLGLNEHIESTIGIIGIAKMLGARTRHEAMLVWLSSVRPQIAKLTNDVSVDVCGPALLTVDGVLSVQLDIHHAVIFRDGSRRVSTMILSELGAVVLAAAGHARWGDDWSRALMLAGPTRPLAYAEDNARTGLDRLPWVAQNPGGPAPWVSAATREEARDSGVAQDIGYGPISALFAEFAKPRHS